MELVFSETDPVPVETCVWLGRGALQVSPVILRFMFPRLARRDSFGIIAEALFSCKDPEAPGRSTGKVEDTSRDFTSCCNNCFLAVTETRCGAAFFFLGGERIERDLWGADTV
jgi:hypothetical protein